MSYFNSRNYDTPTTNAPETPETPTTVLDTDSPYSPKNQDISHLYDEIHSLQNENNILKQNLTNMEKNYQDVPLPSTVIADRTGNSLYTLCPFYTHPENTQLYNEEGAKMSLTPMQSKFIKSLYILCPLTTKHHKNAPVFDEHGKIVKGKELFKNSPNKKPSTRKRSHKSPSPGHKSPSPGHKSKRKAP